MLDEGIKKFVTWSQAEHIAFEDRLLTEQEKLEKAATTEVPKPTRKAAVLPARAPGLDSSKTCKKWWVGWLVG